jgi:DNA-binding response OmpR family regulator
VDESADDRDLFTIVFETYGASVATAASLHEAVQLFERFGPEIVVVNLSLPDHDGAELIREIRKSSAPGAAATPAIAMSWGTAETSRRGALQAGYDKVVSKPLDYDELLHVVAQNYGRIEALRTARGLEIERTAGWRTAPAATPACLEAPVSSSGSLVLGALPQDEARALLEKASIVELEAGMTIAGQGDAGQYVYLPLRALVSMMLLAESGKTVEVCAVGRNGVVGTGSPLGSHLSPFWMNVHLPGEAWRLRSADFEALVGELPALQALVARLRLATLREIAQNVLCNRVHTIDAQVARWLVTITERAQTDVVRLTHESIAERFGTRRPTISLALEALGRSGAVTTTRGHIQIVDPAALANRACECLRAVERVYAAAYQDSSVAPDA